MLLAENEDRIERFLADTPDFQTVPVEGVWRAVLGTDCPVVGDVLHLSPASTGTDGFLAAIL